MWVEVPPGAEFFQPSLWMVNFTLFWLVSNGRSPRSPRPKISIVWELGVHDNSKVKSHFTGKVKCCDLPYLYSMKLESTNDTDLL